MVDYPHATPNVLNLRIGKAAVYFTPAGGTERHLGNCTTFKTSPTVDQLDHFSAMAGTKVKDFSVVVSQAVDLSFTLEELTVDNLAMWSFGGEVTTNTDGDKEFWAGAVSSLVGKLRVHGTNSVGPKYEAVYPSVSIVPDGDYEAINVDGSSFDSFDFKGSVNAVTEGFNTFRLLDSGSTTD